MRSLELIFSGVNRWPVLLCLAAWLVTVALADAAREPRKLRVLTTFLPAYCFAINVAGAAAEVENLGPGSVGPHEFQLAPRDLRRIEQADVLVINGLGLESWLRVALKSVSRDRPLAVVELAAGLDSLLIRTVTPLKSGARADSARQTAGSAYDRVAANGANPHIWLDVSLAQHGVSNILAGLRRADPARGEVYRANAAVYLERLRRLDSDLSSSLAPLKGRAFVTFHDAFPYFVRRYHLNLVGVIELTPDVQPPPKYLGLLLGAIRTNRARVIFTEPQFPGRLPAQIARDAGMAIAELDTLETGVLSPHAYEDGLRRNLRTLNQSLR